PTATAIAPGADAPSTIRTPRLAATSRAHGVTIAPAEPWTSPPGGTAVTSSAVMMSFMGMGKAARSRMVACRGRPPPVLLAADLAGAVAACRPQPGASGPPAASGPLVSIYTPPSDRVRAYGDAA